VIPAPIVGVVCSLNLLFFERWINAVLPTPESPIKMIRGGGPAIGDGLDDQGVPAAGAIVAAH
jgi:hypothetical protein